MISRIIHNENNYELQVDTKQFKRFTSTNYNGELIIV